jgi:hypothetical protein
MTQAKTLFTDLGPLLVVVIGLGVGFKVVGKVKSLFR